VQSIIKFLIKLLVRFVPSGLRRLLFRLFPGFIHRDWEIRGKTYHQEKMSEAYRWTYEYLTEVCLKESPRKILEFGCGYGFLLRSIFEKNKGELEIDFYGMDYSSSQIEQARAYFDSGNFLCRDLTRNVSEYNDLQFDIVIGLSVLMYIQPHQIDSTIRELKRVCKKKVILVEYYYKYLNEENQAAYKVATECDGRNIYDYEEILKNNGLQNVQNFPISFFEDPLCNINNEMPLRLIVGSQN
jgi:SAM-dependent methyltransferase